MTLQRVFLALPLPATPARALFDSVFPHLDTRCRPVPWQNYHITLAFVGRLSEQAFHSLESRLPTLARFLPQTVEIKGVAPFPTTSSRLLAATVDYGPDLRRLYGAVTGLLAAEGVHSDDHGSFKPHITVARNSHSRDLRGGLSALPTGRVELAELGIYEGYHGAEGYRYQCLARIERSAGSSSAKRKAKP